MNMRPCVECARYKPGKHVDVSTIQTHKQILWVEDTCSYVYTDIVTGDQRRLTAREARSYEWACGIEGRHFQPIVEEKKEETKKLSGWCTLQEWIDAYNNSQAFKCQWNKWRKTPTVAKYDNEEWLDRYGARFNTGFNKHAIFLNEDGSLPIAPELRNGMRLPKGWWMAMDDDGLWYASEKEPVLKQGMWISDGANFRIPDTGAPEWIGDWRRSLIRPVYD